ncbi:5-beta-cholestane-3-alpha,7-alpha-diol 12-alpha-hydroxylase-like [Protobothrops mucrosquamatus]|uniref:5-beta-cholestane-3-alpha,7-alpha-diol 12-alpha-hydroxylase-like n=1 Tax=Protobothrops mucrosquamatus TaxID=103944 RepID=UPI0010FBA6FA|nr:5-beta-cholestane-3-alpha,7-alpha-diol 12-alpha-hydroxylase-like [Protobothrops mucrosquamatus]
MGMPLPIVIALVVCLLGALYLMGVFRRRQPNEPPLDKGLIPWLGHALHFRNNNLDFLQSMQKKHGDIFTILIAGQYFTFLMDPLSFGGIIREPRSKLDFMPFATELVLRLFRFKGSHDTHKIIEVSSAKHLKGDGLLVITEALMDALQDILFQWQETSKEDPKSWKEDGLFHFCSNTVFRAGYLALYGTEQAKGENQTEKVKQKDQHHTEEMYIEFCKYEKLFPRLSYALLTPWEWGQMKNLWNYFWQKLSVKNIYQKDNFSRWISDQAQQLAESGISEEMTDRYMFLLLWTALCNTSPASFWLLEYLMKHPKAMEEVKKEILEVLKKSGQEVTSREKPLNVTKEMLNQMPILDSTLEETLRLVTAPLLIRMVLQDMDLKLHNGKSYLLRKGDKIGLFPYLSVHMDPEIHPEPQIFKYDHFLSQNGNKKEFFKNGEKVKYFAMHFGAGASMCPGRYFATNEIKLFAFLMLACFDLELINQQEEIPPIDKTRYGFGVIRPMNDIQFRYRCRC